MIWICKLFLNVIAALHFLSPRKHNTEQYARCILLSDKLEVMT